VLAGV